MSAGAVQDNRNKAVARRHGGLARRGRQAGLQRGRRRPLAGSVAVGGPHLHLVPRFRWRLPLLMVVDVSAPVKAWLGPGIGRRGFVLHVVIGDGRAVVGRGRPADGQFARCPTPASAPRGREERRRSPSPTATTARRRGCWRREPAPGTRFRWSTRLSSPKSSCRCCRRSIPSRWRRRRRNTARRNR